MTTEQPNWEHIAKELGRKVIFALNHLHPRGSGVIMNFETGITIHWRDDFANALELIQATGRIHRSGGKSFARAIIMFPNCSSGRRIRNLVKAKTERIETLTNGDLI